MEGLGGDWLGTGAIVSFNRKYRSFEQAGNFVHSLEIKNQFDWWKYCKSGLKAKNISSNPVEVYKNDWKSWGDWFGYEITDWNVDKIKELLRGLIESGEIIEWANDEAILYSILETKGLYNLSGNKHRNFLKNLPEVMPIFHLLRLVTTE